MSGAEIDGFCEGDDGKDLSCSSVVIVLESSTICRTDTGVLVSSSLHFSSSLIA